MPRLHTRSVSAMIRANTRPDTELEIHYRKLNRIACDQGVKEREERYPTLTPENAQEAIDFQTRRIAEIYSELLIQELDS